MKMIKYSHAYNLQKKLVCIDEVICGGGEVEKYTCITCGNELIPRIGKYNERHFAHRITIDCNGETYLHKLGKELFEEHYKDCVENGIPFWVKLYQEKKCNCSEKEFNRNCELGTELVSIDLTRYYKQIVVEQIDGDFKPDLILTHDDPQKQIFIEIIVTHRSTEKKLGSGIRIIEINVDNEDDLELIKQHELSENDSKLRIVNFVRNEIRETKSVTNCDEAADLFLVYKSGKCFMQTLPINKIQSEQKRLKYSTLFSSVKQQAFENHVIAAYKQKKIAKNCYLCANHAKAKQSMDFIDHIDNIGKAIYCFKNKTRCNSNDAIECEEFKFSENKVREYSYSK